MFLYLKKLINVIIHYKYLTFYIKTMGNIQCFGKKKKLSIHAYEYAEDQLLKKNKEIHYQKEHIHLAPLNLVQKQVDNLPKIQNPIKSKLIRDNVHGNMECSLLELAIIDTVPMKRLKDLRQLGVVSHVYPGAEHSRFVHSLGTAFIAKQIATNIQKNQKELNITNRHIQILGIAGSMHDLGHGPYSHSFESIINRIQKERNDQLEWHHEDMSIKMVNLILNQENLTNQFTSTEKIFIEYCIKPTAYLELEQIYKLYQIPEIEQPMWLFRYIISSIDGIDADRIDYISRDSGLTNVSSTYNYELLIESAKIINKTICWPLKYRDMVVDLVKMRFKLHKTVYEAPAVKKIDLMIRDTFYEIYKAQEQEKAEGRLKNTFYDIAVSGDPLQFTVLRDSYPTIFRYDPSGTYHKVNELLERIDNRDLYKLVGHAKFAKSTTINECICELEAKFPASKGYIVSKSLLHHGSKTKSPFEHLRLYSYDKFTNTHTLHSVKNSLTEADFCENWIWVHRKSDFSDSFLKTEGFLRTLCLEKEGSHIDIRKEMLNAFMQKKIDYMCFETICSKFGRFIESIPIEINIPL